jgi:cytochrome c biogenesis protein CcmG/thiol:disulfide interchange protein DsbE
LLELARSGVTIIGLNYKDDAAAALKWLHDLGDPYAMTISDTDGTLGLDLGVYGAPETYVIDANGRVRHRHVGVVNQTIWEQDLAQFFVAEEAGLDRDGEETGV